MKDLRIVARVYNNQLRERREATGLSACAFARKIGVDPTEYCAYESLKRSPLTSGKQLGRTVPRRWRTSAGIIADALGVEPDVLWPDAVLKIEKSIAEVRVDSCDVPLLTQEPVSPFRLLESGDEREAVEKAIEELSPREQLVIRRRFYEEATLEEVGIELNVSRERLRQIEKKALRKMSASSTLQRAAE